MWRTYMRTPEKSDQPDRARTFNDLAPEIQQQFRDAMNESTRCTAREEAISDPDGEASFHSFSGVHWGPIRRSEGSVAGFLGGFGSHPCRQFQSLTSRRLAVTAPTVPLVIDLLRQVC